MERERACLECTAHSKALQFVVFSTAFGQRPSYKDTMDVGIGAPALDLQIVGAFVNVAYDYSEIFFSHFISKLRERSRNYITLRDIKCMEKVPDFKNFEEHQSFFFFCFSKI